MSVLVSYVHGGMLHEEFARSLSDFYRYDAANRQVVGGVCHVRGLYVADSRNQACKRFMDARYPNGEQPQWLLFLDTDIIFKPTDVYDLLDAANTTDKRIVGGLYFGYLDGNPTPTWRVLHDGANGKQAWGTMAQLQFGVIEPVGAVGMGFTVIHRSVLEALAKTYAHDTWTWFAHDLYGRERLGEDLTFCHRAKAHGFTTWGDSRIVVGHIKPFTITAEHFIEAAERKLADERAPAEEYADAEAGISQNL